MALLWPVRSLKQFTTFQRFASSSRYLGKNHSFNCDSSRHIASDLKLCQRSYSDGSSSKLVIDNRKNWEKTEKKRREVAEAKAKGTMAQIGFLMRALGNIAFLCFCIIFACTATSAWDPGFRRRLRKSYPWFASWTDLVLEKEVEEEEVVLDDALKQKASAEHRKLLMEQLRAKSK